MNNLFLEKKDNRPGLGYQLVLFCTSTGLGFFGEPVANMLLPYAIPQLPESYYRAVTIGTPSALMGITDMCIYEDVRYGLGSALFSAAGIALGMHLGKIYR